MLTPTTHVRASETGERAFAAQIHMGDFALIGDEPFSRGGAGLGPSPFQLLSASLAECTAMTIRWYARQQAWPLDHVAVNVEHKRGRVESADYSVELFEKTVSIAGDTLNGEHRAPLLSKAATCPVHRALEGASLITTRTAD